jgi:proline dehydrogenase
MLLASHNEDSIINTMNLLDDPNMRSRVHFAQLMGLGDNLTYMLKYQGFSVFKYIPYGELKYLMPYLIRRAEESSLMFNSIDI